VDDPRPGHRLDDRANGLYVDFVDPPGEPPQRVDLGRDREPVEVLPPLGEQTHIELLATETESSVQHAKRASLVLRGLVKHA